MRKFIIICLLSLPVCMMAQYRPIITEGKIWTGINYYEHPSSVYMQYIKGDTVINATHYKKAYMINYTRYKDRRPHYISSVREEDGKVFCILPTSSQERKVMDLSVEKGCPSWIMYEDPVMTVDCDCAVTMDSVNIKRIDQQYTKGNMRGVFLNMKNANGGLLVKWFLAEGIGDVRKLQPFDVFISPEWGNVGDYLYSFVLDLVFEEGDVAYNGKTLSTLSLALAGYYSGHFSDAAVPVIRDSPAATFDLFGRKIGDRPAPGIYIKNGKKYVK